MKKLITIAALGLAISLPAFTLALIPIDLYTKIWIFSGLYYVVFFYSYGSYTIFSLNFIL